MLWPPGGGVVLSFSGPVRHSCPADSPWVPLRCPLLYAADGSQSDVVKNLDEKKLLVTNLH